MYIHYTAYEISEKKSNDNFELSLTNPQICDLV